MRSNEFKTYHPIVNFIYFVFVIGFSMFFMHPVCLLISIIGGFLYSVCLKGRGVIKQNLLYMLPMMIAMALINPAVNHQGVTILAYLPSGNPLTAESVVYGLCAAAMLASVICWFLCWSEIMTSDKFIYLFGRVIPSLSLVLSMTLRLVPRFINQMRVVTNAQRGIGRDISNGSVIRRAKCGLSILSVMVTWSLENALETADSMKSRGYGLQGRTAFSIFTFDRRDRRMLLCILLLGFYIIWGGISGRMYFGCFPSFRLADISICGTSVFLAYLTLCNIPLIIEVWETRKWKSIKSKI